MIALRPATAADARRLYDWRNAPDVRAASLSTAPLEWDRHVAWLTGALADPARAVLVIEADGAPAGTLRFDRRGPDTAEVSILVAADCRGRGIGEAALRAAILQPPLSVARLTARIRPGNAASLALFARAGFEVTGQSDPIVMEHRMTDKTPQDLIIDEIEAVRTRNNKNWMDILRLAFRHAPDEAAAILAEIYKEDKAISDLAAKLTTPRP